MRLAIAVALIYRSAARGARNVARIEPNLSATSPITGGTIAAPTFAATLEELIRA